MRESDRRLLRTTPEESASKNDHTRQETTTSNTIDATSSSASFEPYGIPQEVFELQCANDDVSMMSCSIIRGPNGNLDTSPSERWAARGRNIGAPFQKTGSFEQVWDDDDGDGDGDDDLTLDFTRVSI